MVSFYRSESDPFEEEDLAFAEELAARASLAIDNARRYTREHALAETLQHSLLPHALPDSRRRRRPPLPARPERSQAATGSMSSRCPAPGSRWWSVTSSGTACTPRPPWVGCAPRYTTSPPWTCPRTSCSGTWTSWSPGSTSDEHSERRRRRRHGATCLYAIYDPVSRVCSLARSGHPGPALVHPDGTVEFLQVPVSPPLGLGGGLPFETAEFTLAEGSRLVLYTDGLIQDRDRSIDTGLETLRDALAHPGRTPEETCQDVFDSLLPVHPSDDVALLVACTRLLHPSQVADWKVPNDPAVIAGIRADVARRLEAWGLEEVAFTTELVISELVTNAIRYGTDPIRLRLLHDRNSLICEVADGSSTSPHLRRATTTDEGGRGLFLVAQFAHRWGTRYTARGKVIWTEQSLHGPAAEPAGAVAEALLDQWDDAAW